MKLSLPNGDSITPARVFLKKGRDGPVRGGNPWVFSQAIDRVEPAATEPGARVWVLDAAGATLGHGYYNSATTIAVRMLALDGEPGPAEIVGWRIERALNLRERVVDADTDCYRLLNGDGDGLSGVVVDRYGEAAVMQLLTAGAERMRDEIVGHLQAATSARMIFERSQGAVRRQEGLEDRVGAIVGAPAGESVVRENGIRMTVDLERGQKTGAFLDQRENRARFGALAAGARVLDLCCHTGGFALNAIKGGASEVVAIDTSAHALDYARRNLELNAYPANSIRFVHAEAGDFLSAGGGERFDPFDLIVLDPSPFARSRADARRAEHLYVELNALALGALALGGFLMTFSCSSHFCGEDFVRAVRIAEGRSRRRRMRLLARLGPGPDHPVLLGHPEGEYLTGVLLRDLG